MEPPLLRGKGSPTRTAQGAPGSIFGARDGERVGEAEKAVEIVLGIVRERLERLGGGAETDEPTLVTYMVALVQMVVAEL